MRISVTVASRLLPLLVILLVTQGCDQKLKQAQTQALAPPIIDTPPLKPATVSPADLPPPVVGAPPASNTASAIPPPKPVETPKKPVHHPKKVTPATALPTQPTQETSNGTGTAPSVSAIGQLSSGASGDLRTQTEEAINSTEKGLNAITRTLSDPETKTAAQIREFLKQAREALTTGDVDGALTLTKKAKVLLAELNQ